MLNVSDLGGTSTTSGSVGRVIRASGKYVNLDLSGSTLTNIEVCAFENCEILTSITIPNNVTVINNYIFTGCTKLASVTLGNRVEIIGLQAFSGCTSLGEITIPASVRKITMWAFDRCPNLLTMHILCAIPLTGNPATNYLDQEAFGVNDPSDPDYKDSLGDLRAKYYTQSGGSNGTPGTYSRPSSVSKTWTWKPYEGL